MMKLLDTNEHLYSPVMAELKAAELQANDPDWKYIVRHDPKGIGYSFIEIYDEDNRFISKF